MCIFRLCDRVWRSTESLLCHLQPTTCQVLPSRLSYLHWIPDDPHQAACRFGGHLFTPSQTQQPNGVHCQQAHHYLCPHVFLRCFRYYRIPSTNELQ